MSDFHDKDNEPIFYNLINNAIITRANSMKRIVAFHFSRFQVRQTFCKAIYFLFNSNKFFFR